MANKYQSSLFRLLFLILSAVCQAQGDGMREALIKGLRPSDLTLSKARLTKRLARIGKRSGQFELDSPEVEQGYVAKVLGASSEWVVILSNNGVRDESQQSYWICPGRKGVEVSNSLPVVEEEADGPILGSWRRYKNYLIGTGECIAYHSPAFAESAIEVLEIRGQTLVAKQVRYISNERNPSHFVSDQCNDVKCQIIGGAFNTIEETRKIEPTQEVLYRLSKGKYRAVSSRTVHDILWALDRLATAALFRREEVLREMVPVKRQRHWLARQIRKCIAQGQTRVEEVYGSSEVYFYALGDGFTIDAPFAFRLVKKKGHWCVARIRHGEPEGR